MAKSKDEPSELEKARREKGTMSEQHQALNAQAGAGRARHRHTMNMSKHTRMARFKMVVDGNEVESAPVLIHTTKTPPWKKRAKNRKARKDAKKQR